MKKNRRIVMPLLVFILVIGGWELYVRAFDIHFIFCLVHQKLSVHLLRIWIF